MQFHKILISSAIAFAASSAVAGAWEHEHERGVDLYRAADGDMVVSLVCDPNTVYGTTESAVLLEAGSDPDLSAEVSFSFPDGNTVNTTLVHGRFGKATANPVEWETLVDGFRAHQTVTVSRGEAAVDVELGDPMPFTCL
ncbi:MAG: hypothetical protein HEP70_20085 [Rhodobiaceae bacterium]|uniref:Uncharacterized protein n=1 Tax=Phaeobacter piscinae TaxID=1580596 RepID=A0ABM7D920_9RHOB|nr:MULTISPECIES: hypothetical protein [Rhodobacterales]ATG37975.1 hypothetical protein PhaeoP36_03899 [Phaeobacter piscinae]AUQ88496.1 hypothetical protein PhaeoP42_03900 [Phaeobacter piscinae]MCE8001135.1 hypothetical protein [Rhodobiaceae bacterium]